MEGGEGRLKCHDRAGGVTCDVVTMDGVRSRKVRSPGLRTGMEGCRVGGE